jgi:hypothetical protein
MPNYRGDPTSTGFYTLESTPEIPKSSFDPDPISLKFEVGSTEDKHP